ncbi:collagen-like protein [Saprospiraceae bacterium]|nr:collagen-like protein [Saprospiraceae bacterium]|tara:strand:+ start:17621 stop:19321 length:1701 start_codon:yes stop_codon:yes gene_type:complete
MVVKLSDHLNISLGLQALVDSAAVTAIIRDTNIAMDSGTMGDFVGTIGPKGSNAGITVLNSGTNDADVLLRLDSAVAATLSGTQTLTNKSINLTNNSLTGTIGQWNAALSGGNSFATLTGTETFTNKTLTTPSITGVGAIGGSITDISTFSLRDNTVASYELILAANSSVNASADRTLTFDVGNANRTLSALGNLAFGGSFTTSGAYATTLTTGGTTALTLPTSGTVISKDDSGDISGIRNITVTGTVDGRDVSTDGGKLDNVEANADVTDAANVGSALTAFTTGTDAVGTDIIPVFDVSAGTWEKHTITNAGLAGQKGQKGQTGGAGGDGAKGQKGEGGANGSKGQKGEVGVKGSTGGAGDKGQKGEAGTNGAKGQKGETGSKGQKGQKGEIGADGNGASGTKGQKGQTGDKGQKGEVGQKGGTGTQGQKGEGNEAITNTTAPGSAVDGDLWWDDETGSLYIYYDDGTSSQWVQFNNSVVSDGAISTAKLANDAVTGAKIADDTINSEHYAAYSIDSEHLANNSVIQDKLADDAVGSNELKSVVSFVIYNSGGTALKTLYGAGGA